MLWQRLSLILGSTFRKFFLWCTSAWEERASCSVTSDCCDPIDCSPPGSSVHRILQARIQEWVAISFSRGSPWPKDQIWSLGLLHCRQILYQLTYEGSPISNAGEKKKKSNRVGDSEYKLSCTTKATCIKWRYLFHSALSSWEARIGQHIYSPCIYNTELYM